MVDKFDIKQVRLLAEGGDAYSQDILNAYAQGLNDMRCEFSGGLKAIADYHAGMANKWRFSWQLSMVLVAAFAGLWIYELVEFLGRVS